MAPIGIESEARARFSRGSRQLVKSRSHSIATRTGHARFSYSNLYVERPEGFIKVLTEKHARREGGGRVEKRRQSVTPKVSG
ncbi:hypothetical protein KM043_015772 [Ampulex compressa]|nr:hypothetical protein KM043_015772 [Ampulex compressa]